MEKVLDVEFANRLLDLDQMNSLTFKQALADRTNRQGHPLFPATPCKKDKLFNQAKKVVKSQVMKKAIIILVAVFTATLSFSQSITFWSSMSGPIGGRADTTEHIIDIGLQGVVIYDQNHNSVYDLDYLSGNFTVDVHKSYDAFDLIDLNGRRYRLYIYRNPVYGITHMVLFDVLPQEVKTVSGKVFIK